MNEKTYLNYLFINIQRTDSFEKWHPIALKNENSTTFHRTHASTCNNYFYLKLPALKTFTSMIENVLKFI